MNAGDESGYSVAVGDVNGDGIPDLIITAPMASPNGVSDAGSVYVVFGTKTGFPNPLPLNSLNGTNGFRLDGVTVPNVDAVGQSLAVGDINGDGIPDIIIGAPVANSVAGYTYVVFGGPGPKGDPSHTWATSIFATAGFPGTFELNLTGTGTGFINGTNGFRLDGVTAGDQSGQSLAVGDINGDGIPDIIIGAL